MSKHYTELLRHILDECDFILSKITSQTTKKTPELA